MTEVKSWQMSLTHFGQDVVCRSFEEADVDHHSSVDLTNTGQLIKSPENYVLNEIPEGNEQKNVIQIIKKNSCLNLTVKLKSGKTSSVFCLFSLLQNC